VNFIPKIEYTELNTGVAKSFTFDSAPEGDPFNEEIKTSTKVTTSNDGTQQVQFNYAYENISLEFTFQTEATKQAVEDFFKAHAVRLGKFNYFPSSDEADFKEYTLDQKDIKFSRPIPTGTAGVFEYDFKLKFRRVL